MRLDSTRTERRDTRALDLGQPLVVKS